MSALRELRARFTADVNGIRQGVDEAKRKLSELGKASEQATKRFSDKMLSAGKNMKDFGKGMQDTGKTLSKWVTAPMTALGGALIKTGVQYKAFKQESQQAFSVLLGSAEAAEQHMENIMDFAKTTPFAFPDLVSASRKLISFGMTAEDTHPVMEAIANAVAAMGGSGADIEGLADVFAKITSNGRITGQELNQLSDRGINALMILANQAGVSMEEMRKRISAGAMDSETAIEWLVDGMMNGTKGVNGETVALGGSLDALKDTWAGAVDSMRGAWRRAGDAIISDEIFAKLTETVNKITEIIGQLPELLGPLVESLTDIFMKLIDVLVWLVDGFFKLSDPIQQVILRVGLFAVALGPILIGVGGFIRILAGLFTTLGTVSGALLTTVKGTAAATPKIAALAKVFAFITGPVGIAVAAIIALGVAFVSAWKNSETFREFVMAMIGYLKDFGGYLKEFVNGIKGLFKDDGEMGRDILRKLGVNEDLIEIMDKIAAKIAEFRHKISDAINGFKGLFKDDGQGGRDFLSSLGFSDALITRIDNWARDISAFRGNIDEVMKAIREMFRGNDEKGRDMLVALGFTPEFINRVSTFVERVEWFRDKVSMAFAALFKFLNGDTEGAGDILTRMGLSDSTVDRITTIVTGIQNSLRKIFDAVVGFIGDTGKKVMDFFRSDGRQMMDAAKNVFDFIVVSIQFLGTVAAAIFKGMFAVIQFIMPAILAVIKVVWGNITGVISGAIDVIMGLVKFFTGLFTGDFAKMWEGLKQIFFGAVEFLWNFIQLTFFGRILGGARLFVLSFRGFFVSLWQGIVALFRGRIVEAWRIVQAGWTGLYQNTVKIFNAVVGFFRSIWTTLVALFRSRISGIQGVVIVAWNYIYAVTSTVFNAVRDFLSSAWSAIRAVFVAALNIVINFVQERWRALQTNTSNVFNAVRNFLAKIWSAIYTRISERANAIWSVISNIWERIHTRTSSIFGTIRDFLSRTWTNIRDTINTFTGNIQTRVSNVWDTVLTRTRNAFRDVYNAVRDRFTDIVNAARDLPQRISNGLTAMASKVTAGVNNVVNRMAGALERGINGVIGGVNTVLSRLGVDTRVKEISVPRYAHGTGEHPGGLAIVGDGTGDNAGPELVTLPNGKQYLSPDKPTLVNLAEGAQVLSAKLTRKFFGNVPKYARGTIQTIHDWTVNRAKDVAKTVAPVVNNIKSAALDVFSYIKNPSGLLDLALSSMGIKRPSGLDFVGSMARGAWDTVKNAAVDMVRKNLNIFANESGPVNFGSGFRKTSSYGWRIHPITGIPTFHNGDDYGAAPGTPIPNQAAGRVTQSGYHSIRGNYVRVNSGNMDRIYQHNTRNLVKVGDMVRKGQILGTVGSTGASTGPHLHFEVLRNGKNIKPGALGGYADGGIIGAKQLAWLAEGGWAESVISHDPAKKASQAAIWNKTGDMLGFSGGGQFPKEAVDLLAKILHAVEMGHKIVMNEQVVAEILHDPITKLQELEGEVRGIYKR